LKLWEDTELKMTGGQQSTVGTPDDKLSRFIIDDDDDEYE
jgi:hypothetical protein